MKLTDQRPAMSPIKNPVRNGLIGAQSINWYGVTFNESNSSPDLERIASNMTLHATLPVHSLIKGCVLNTDGMVNYYLKSDDWTKKADGAAADLSGADGNVMIEVPTYYRKVENPSSGVYHHKISIGPLAGFQKINKFYIGAYKSTVNRTGTIKQWSIINTDAEYRGGNNNATLDGTPATQLSKPATTISLASFRTYARNIVADEYKWNVITWKHSMLLYELLFIEYATLNSQKAIVFELTSEGYKQGGLGSGVTTVDSTTWNNFNGYYPLIPCGSSNSLANGSGEVNYTIPNFGHASGAVKVNRYRGVENPFGDIWEWCDGVSVYHGSVTSDFYTCENSQHFVDGADVNYTKRSELPTSSGYLKYATHDNNGIITPKEVGGSSATYFCDYFYTPGLIDAWRAVVRGGAAHLSSRAGFACLHSIYSGSYTFAYFGARLCYIS